MFRATSWKESWRREKKDRTDELTTTEGIRDAADGGMDLAMGLRPSLGFALRRKC